MIYTVIILICLAIILPKDCHPGNAVDEMHLDQPEQGLSQCMTAGILYAAASNLVIPGKTYPKVYCKPG